MNPPTPDDHAAHEGELATPANWRLRDVVVGIALLLVLRSLPLLIGRQSLAPLPTWLLLGASVLLPQAFFLAYPLIVARRRGIASPFPSPRSGSPLVEALIAVPVVIGLIGTLIFTTVIVSVLWPRVSLTPEIVQQAAQAPTVSFVIFMAVAVTLVAPVGEEVFFRGFLQGALRSRMPVVIAALVQSAIFGALHTFGAVHGVVVFFLGLVLTSVCEWRKTLLAPIFVHAGNNLFAALCFVAMAVLNAYSPALGVLGRDHPQGYQVDKVIPGAAAAKVGIAEGDIITSLNGEPVTGARQLVIALRLHHVGDTVTVEILHDGESQELKVVLEKRPDSP